MTRFPAGLRDTRTMGLAAAVVLASLTAAGCESPENGPADDRPTSEQSDPSDESTPAGSADTRGGDSNGYAAARQRMVEKQLRDRNIDDSEVLEAMRTVERHTYVPAEWRSRAYEDSPLPIGHDQTISQPYIVALMTQTLAVDDDHKVLEIGTGSGYQAAILGELVDHLYTIEIVCELAERADTTLDQQGYDNITVQCGDGYEGWPEHAPFDRIIVTAAPPEIPEALVDQLKVGGRMVLPVGERIQQLKVVEKKEDGTVETIDMMKVRFVPMVPGKDGEQ